MGNTYTSHDPCAFRSEATAAQLLSSSTVLRTVSNCDPHHTTNMGDDVLPVVRIDYGLCGCMLSIISKK